MARRSSEQTRRHILDVAGDLFYARGARAVGMDLVIKTAEVANATLYRQFPTKDELLTAYLVDRNTGWWERLRVATDGVPDARDRLLALVDMTVDDMRQPGYRGCATLNVTSEFPDESHPAHQAALAHKREVLHWLREQAAQAGAANPDALADQLMIVLDGAQVLAAAMGPEGPSSRMRALVEGLLPKV
ncbi:putative TetR-family transcriptional regulator [Actinoplanes missouriensis 431]|uniref:Putative TetR-family transcriptional regulator n=1 Tax=Actinoplanes missouriensis (strain ATCC 14538 / DSM 43046 / CBS 188.64 / JCM 3121 / NBRC 102363 / NCIMB 12654 / NRRL B-3342 / UNCC 431) TaxID=512565 RepID=I0HJH4_ACTM4|nr:TetR/AcrR family transcriptional regulator [Actinoplanes missouriensis]BAL93161.1 putative TetR-family transcriptional regulator [Actinoplanes missouriensis 431]